MRSLRLLPALLPLLLLLTAGRADAASCKFMTVRYALSTGNVIALDPEQQRIPFKGCVRFTSQIATSVTVTVSGGYSVQLGPGETTPAKDAYVGASSGRKSVTANSGPTTANGSINVAKAPQPARTSSSRPPQTAEPSPTPARSSSGPARPQRPSTRTTGPRLAPTPHVKKVSPVPTPAPTAPSLAPTPSPSSSPTAVVAGPLEPPSGRGTGLPAAVAALAVVGTAAGIVRVLLAEPLPAVDSGRTVVAGP